jgi:DNA primase
MVSETEEASHAQNVPFDLPRDVPKAMVSTPLKWTEVRRGLDPTKFTMQTLPRRLEKIGDLLGAGPGTWDRSIRVPSAAGVALE